VNAFVHHFAYDFRTGIRDRSRLLMFYLFPLVFFVLMGSLMSSANPDFLERIIPGMALFAFMCASLLSLPNGLVNAREAGVFRSYRINGVPALSIIGIPVLGTAVHMAIVTALITVAGARFFGGVRPVNLAGFAAAAALSYLAFAGIGSLIGVAAGSATLTILLSQLIYIPSIVLGGIMVPASILPPTLARISLLLPATHCMRVLEGLAMPGSGAVPWRSLGVLAAGAALCFVLARLLFEWDARSVTPSRRAWCALLGAAPFVAAAVLGG
jgi:ABC-2 type transport system permease protein